MFSLKALDSSEASCSSKALRSFLIARFVSRHKERYSELNERRMRRLDFCRNVHSLRLRCINEIVSWENSCGNFDFCFTGITSFAAETVAERIDDASSSDGRSAGFAGEG